MKKSPKISILDIAKKAGVSRTTVSYVINKRGNISQKTIDRVQLLMKKLDYVPSMLAQRFSSGKSRNILIVPPRYQGQFSDHYFGSCLDSIYSEAEEFGFSLRLHIFNENEAKQADFRQLFRKGEMDGILFIGLTLDPKILKSLPPDEYPHILLNSYANGVKRDCVCVDNYSSAFQGCTYLYELGHRKIAHITGYMEKYPAQVRAKAYKDFLSTKGLPFRKGFFQKGEFNIETGATAFKKLMDMKDRPTAIFCANDSMAIGAMHAAREKNIQIPEDISILGMDDIPACLLMQPALTTMKQQQQQMAATATRMLIHRIKKRSGASPEQSLHVMELVKRQSCGKILL